MSPEEHKAEAERLLEEAANAHLLPAGTMYASMATAHAVLATIRD